MQVLCSLAIGFGIIQMSHRLFGVRGALVSGYGWACYLPLAFYTHHLWPETLFLCLFVPSMYVVLCFLVSDTERGRWGLKLAAAGALFGLSLYLKESLLYLPIPLTIALFFRKPRAPTRTVLAFPLVVAAVLTPLAIRNWDYYDRFVPAGASLGINVFAGLNKYYVNPDYNCDPDLVWRVHRDQDGQLDFVGRHFLEYGDGWLRPRSRFQIRPLFSQLRQTRCAR